MTTVRATAVVLLLALACSACSGSGPSAVQWPASVVSKVVNSCEQGGGTNTKCGCAVRYLEDHYDPSSFTNGNPQQALDEATKACTAGLGNSGNSGNGSNTGNTGTWITSRSGSTTTLTYNGTGAGGTPTFTVPGSARGWLIHYSWSCSGPPPGVFGMDVYGVGRSNRSFSDPVANNVNEPSNGGSTYYGHKTGAFQVAINSCDWTVVVQITS